MTAPVSGPIVLATHNEKKKRELAAILGELWHAEVEVLTAGELGLPDVRETGTTFRENAELKARAAHEATGHAAIADDSGIVVDVLGAAPGILSARWAGRHGDDAANTALLLAQIADLEDEHRGAAYVAAACFVDTDGATVTTEGRMTGTLLREGRGVNGFGYDPIFLPTGSALTAAEMSPEEKNSRSHRRTALSELAEKIARTRGM